MKPKVTLAFGPFLHRSSERPGSSNGANCGYLNKCHRETVDQARPRSVPRCTLKSALPGQRHSTSGPEARELTKTRRKSARKTRRVCEKIGKGPAARGCDLFWILRMSWECAQRPADGTFQVHTGHMASSSASSSQGKSRRSTGRWWTLSATLPQIQRTASLSRVKSTMWRTSCCAPLRILRAVRSCRPSYTKRSYVRWLWHVIPLSELSGSLFLDSSDLRSIRPLLQHLLETPMEGPQR